MGDNLGKCFYDHNWMKKNGRISEAFEKAGTKKPPAGGVEESCGSGSRQPPPSTLLSKMLSPSTSKGKWQGGALQRLGQSCVKAAGGPPVGLGQPKPRPPAPTTSAPGPLARIHADPTLAPRVPAPAAGGTSVTGTAADSSKPPLAPPSTMDAAMRERCNIKKEEAMRKLRVNAQHQHHHQHHHQHQHQQPQHAPTPPPPPPPKKPATAQMHSFASAGRTASRVSGAAKAPGPNPDAQDKNQPFQVDIDLATNECDAKDRDKGDRLLVRAKSFHGYPALAVLNGLQGVGKKIVEKGSAALWEVRPATAYTMLLASARGQRLLAVEDKVEQRLKALREDVGMGEKRLARAEDDAKVAGVALPAAVAEAAGRAGGAAAAAEAGGDRAGRGGGRRGGRGARGGGTGRGVRKSDSADAAAAGSPPKRWNPEPWSTSAAADERIGGMNEKELAAAIDIALRQMPMKISPATASSADVARVLRAVQAAHGINLGLDHPRGGGGGVPCGGGVATGAQGGDLQLPSLVARAVQRCGFPTDFLARGATLAAAAKGEGRYTPASRGTANSHAARAAVAGAAGAAAAGAMTGAPGARVEVVGAGLVRGAAAGTVSGSSGAIFHRTSPPCHSPEVVVLSPNRGAAPAPAGSETSDEVQFMDDDDGDEYDSGGGNGGGLGEALGDDGAACPEVQCVPGSGGAVGGGGGGDARGVDNGVECIDLVSDDDDEEHVGGATPAPSSADAPSLAAAGAASSARAAAAAAARVPLEQARASAARTESPTIAEMFGWRKAGSHNGHTAGSVPPQLSPPSGPGPGVCLGVPAEERRAKLAAINDAAVDLSRLRKELARLEAAVRPVAKRKWSSAPSESKYSANYGGGSFDFGTGAGLGWEGQGGGSMGMNVEHNY